jgi:hypothetical protein
MTWGGVGWRAILADADTAHLVWLGWTMCLPKKAKPRELVLWERVFVSARAGSESGFAKEVEDCLSMPEYVG